MRSKAFTLIELLVVIAIIGLLVSILLPSLAKARAMTRTVVCQTNLHAIGRAAAMYSMDYNDFVPRESGSDRYPIFYVVFLPYLGGHELPMEDRFNAEYHRTEVLPDYPVFKCPSIADERYVMTYIINNINYDHYQDNGKYRWQDQATQVSKLPFAGAEALYISEGNFINRLGWESFGGYDVYSPSHMPFKTNGDPNNSPRMIRHDDMRHDGKTTIIAFDGHSEQRELTPEDLPIRLFNPLDSNAD